MLIYIYSITAAEQIKSSDKKSLTSDRVCVINKSKYIHITLFRENVRKSIIISIYFHLSELIIEQMISRI